MRESDLKHLFQNKKLNKSDTTLIFTFERTLSYSNPSGTPDLYIETDKYLGSYLNTYHLLHSQKLHIVLNYMQKIFIVIFCMTVEVKQISNAAIFLKYKKPPQRISKGYDSDNGFGSDPGMSQYKVDTSGACARIIQV